MRKSLFAGFLLFPACRLTAQESINNDSVIKLMQTGLPEKLIAPTINASSYNYDTGTGGGETMLAVVAIKVIGCSDNDKSKLSIKLSFFQHIRPI